MHQRAGIAGQAMTEAHHPTARPPGRQPTPSSSSQHSSSLWVHVSPRSSSTVRLGVRWLVELSSSALVTVSGGTATPATAATGSAAAASWNPTRLIPWPPACRLHLRSDLPHTSLPKGTTMGAAIEHLGAALPAMAVVLPVHSAAAPVSTQPWLA